MEDYMDGEDQTEELFDHRARKEQITMDRKGQVILKEFHYLRYILLALICNWILHHPLRKDNKMKASIPHNKMKNNKMKASIPHNKVQDKETLENLWIN